MFHVKQITDEYLLVIDILSEVLDGKNLNEVFANYTNNPTMPRVNINKIKDLSYGLLRNYFSLTMLMSALVHKKITAVELELILIIGIYEIEYTKKPEYAVVNDLVSLAELISKNLQQKNFVNAVLRNYLRTREALKAKLATSQEYQLNFPLWWIKKLKNDYGVETALEIMHNLNSKPKFALRVNSQKTTVANYVACLIDKAIEYKLVDGKIVLAESLAVNQIPLFNDGYVSIQDVNAQKLIDLIKLEDGMYVLDACCAPGGKACQILENYNVELLAVDIDKSRLGKVRQNLERLGLYTTIVQDNAATLIAPDSRLFDVIIADVPCSASGTVKRNPDIKLQRKLSDINNFVGMQRKIIINLWRLLKPGGIMCYITCSIFAEENQGNIKYLSEKLSDCKIVKQLNLLPTPDTDGFYYCILEKVAE